MAFNKWPCRLELAHRKSCTVANLQHLTTRTRTLLLVYPACWHVSYHIFPILQTCSPSRTLLKAQPKTFGPLDEKEITELASVKETLGSSPSLAFPKRNGWYAVHNDCFEKRVKCAPPKKREDRSNCTVDNQSLTQNDKEQRSATMRR